MSAIQAARRLAHRSALKANGRQPSAPAPVAGDDGRTNRLALRMFLALVALAGLTLAVHAGGRFAGTVLARGGHTASTETYSVTMGNDLLAITANMIRFKSQRRSGEQERLDLYMLFPGSEGYSEVRKEWFNDRVQGDRRLVFVTIDERQMSRDMSGRLQPIYAAITVPAGDSTESGLERRTFRPDAGYANEILLVGPQETGNERYVVRCLDGPEAAAAMTACERDIHVGANLSLTYRFPRSMLPQWQALEAEIRAFAISAISAPSQ